ncbi:MAG TPA: hypothetical protein VJT08_18800 [Terriglobales bacterium]|nr:hypothetical protein [Terriglobales bacterium]
MKLKALLSAILFAVFGLAALAQQEPAFPGTQASIVVSAEAQHGTTVPALRAEDVIVTQGKQRDQVISLEPLFSSQAGVQAFILIDDSLSTSDLGPKLNDIRQFIGAQPANVQVGVAYMRNGTVLIAQNPTNDRAAAAKALRLPTGESAGGASPYFSVGELIKRWPETNAARQVVMISDGIDPYWDSFSLDDPYVNEAIDLAQRARVVVNAIYARGDGHLGHTLWRNTLGQSFLSELADSSGGEAYYLATDSPPSFTPYLNQIAKRMQHAYLLTFKAQPGPKSGMQPVKISTEVPNVDLVAQSRVYVPVS